MQTFEERFKALASGENLAGIFETGRDLTTAIEARFGKASHAVDAIHNVILALENCYAVEQQKISDAIERARIAAAIASGSAIEPPATEVKPAVDESPAAIEPPAASNPTA